jgi:hypothetical protein
MAASMLAILALSVTDKIEQYGAYAGFASVLGLAVLSLLYFAQAREVKRLREWAGRAPERAAELQDRVQADAQRRPAAVPAQPAAQAQPARPAGVAAPAAAAAAAAGPAPATAAGQAQQGAGAAPGTPGAPGIAAPATAAAAGAAAAAAPAAASQPTTVQPAAAPAAAGGPGGNGTPAPPPARPGQPLRVPPARPAAAAGAMSARSLGAPPEGRSRGTVLAIAGAIAAVIVVGLLLVFVVFGGADSGDSGPARSTTPSATTPSSSDGTSTNGRATTTPLAPSAFTTSVLNGTTVPGLARGVANRLAAAHFDIGTVTNALDQSRSQTLVEYAPGHRREGLLAAKAIDVQPDAVQQASDGSRTIAGQDAVVIVTVGNDQNQSPQQ